jgi:hypothetical protein
MPWLYIDLYRELLIIFQRAANHYLLLLCGCLVTGALLKYFGGYFTDRRRWMESITVCGVVQCHRAGGSHQGNTSACRAVGNAETAAAQNQIATIRIICG